MTSMDLHDAATGETIWIESTRSSDGQEPACLLQWGPIDRYALVPDVRQTAEDLMTCAAYADLIGELLSIGLGTPELNGLTGAMLKKRQPRYFGTPQTLFLLPAGSSKQRQGVVLLGRQDRFHKGDADAVLLPDEARAMARHWMQAAEAAEADTLFSAVLSRSGWLPPSDLDAVFALVKDIREGRATLPPEPPTT